MPRSKPPRRPHRPRLPAIPSTGIIREFAREFDVALLALRHGVFSDAHYEALGQGLNVIGLALEVRADLRDHAIQVGSAANAMNAIDARRARTGQLRAGPYEIEPIRLGVNAAIAALPRLTINELYAAMRRLHAIELAEARAARSSAPTERSDTCA